MKKKSNQINIPDNEWPKKGKYMRNFRPRSDKGPRYRTSLEMDGTLNFDCYSLGVETHPLIILHQLNQSL